MIHVDQILVGGFDLNFSYIFFDQESKDMAVVDPTGNVSLILDDILKYKSFNMKYILLTHGHPDHVAGVGEFRKSFDVPVVADKNSSFKSDIQLSDGDKLPFGDAFIECIHTPGHTKDSVIYHLSDDSAIFTGDTLFVDWCGFCEARTMFDTMRNKIFPLADSNMVYSGHNYGHKPCSKLGEEKINNPYLYITNFEKFQDALKNL